MRLQDKIGLDKCCHFFAGAAIAYTVDAILGHATFGPLCGFWAATLAGMAKEAVDKAMDELPDWQDILATTLGGLVPLALAGVALII